jgi:hypothetical protein
MGFRLAFAGGGVLLRVRLLIRVLIAQNENARERLLSERSDTQIHRDEMLRLALKRGQSESAPRPHLSVDVFRIQKQCALSALVDSVQ